MMAFDIGAVLGAQVSNLDTKEVTMIPIQFLFRNHENFYTVELDEDLVDSIRMHGILEPLLVVKAQAAHEGYRVISGHRRLKALRHLPESRPHTKAPCIVLEDDLPPYKEMQLLIEANRQRKKTSWEIGEEARRLTEAYNKAKEAGEDLPGRIRDRVAAAMKENASRLGRLQAIEKKLQVPEFIRDFKADKIPESVAYAISQLDTEWQYRFLDYYIAAHEPLTEKLVKRFVKEQEKGESQETGVIETHAKQETVSSHSEREIYDVCIDLMQDVFDNMVDFMEWNGFAFSRNDADENYPVLSYSQQDIVRRLFLGCINHSCGVSTLKKCEELDLRGETIWFEPAEKPDDDDDLEGEDG